MLGEETVVAALCDRTNEAGTTRLRELILGRSVREFLEVPLPPNHIDGDFMILGEHLCLIHEPIFQNVVCRLFEAGRVEPRRVSFLELLDERHVARIPITETERLQGALNIVVIQRRRRAVAPGHATRLVAELERRGWQVTPFPSTEMAAGNGGVYCMTCPVHVT